jgi:signal peptidase II
VRKVLFIVFSVVALDQLLKIWIKLNFLYGESIELIPGWLDFQFVENPGMAFGWMFPGTSGKLALSIFRIIVVIAIIIYIYKLTRKRTHQGYLFCLALIVAGALGNIIDSAVYGMCFDKGSTFDPHFQDYTAYSDTAAFASPGYAPFLMGNVVDMVHITKEFDFPSWSPIHAGERAEIFPPIFNIADASISVGIILILLFQRRFFKEEDEDVSIEEAFAEVNTSA